MGEYLDDLWNDLEQTWELAMKVNDLQAVSYTHLTLPTSDLV